MPAAFAHEAVLSMESDADTAAPGAAITVALCGHWEHQPPCPLAPHHTTATRAGATVLVRTLFVTEPVSETEVRTNIDNALKAGRLRGPIGQLTEWQVLSSRRSAVLPEETEQAQRLAASQSR